MELYVEVGNHHGIPAFKYQWNWVQYHNVDVRVVILVLMVLMGWVSVDAAAEGAAVALPTRPSRSDCVIIVWSVLDYISAFDFQLSGFKLDVYSFTIMIHSLKC